MDGCKPPQDPMLQDTQEMRPFRPEHMMSVLCIARVLIMLHVSLLESDTGIDWLHHMVSAV